MFGDVRILLKPYPPEYESDVFEIEQQFMSDNLTPQAEGDIIPVNLFIQKVELIDWLLDKLNGVACEGRCIIRIRQGYFYFKGNFYVYYPLGQGDLQTTFVILTRLRQAGYAIASLPIEFEEINVDFTQQFLFDDGDKMSKDLSREYKSRAVYAAWKDVGVEVCQNGPCPYYLPVTSGGLNSYGQPGVCCYGRMEAKDHGMKGIANCEKVP
jgi:hypothetical protein